MREKEKEGLSRTKEEKEQEKLIEGGRVKVSESEQKQR